MITVLNFLIHFLDNIVKALGNIIGFVNEQNISGSLLTARVVTKKEKTLVKGTVKNLPKSIGLYI